MTKSKTANAKGIHCSYAGLQILLGNGIQAMLFLAGGLPLITQKTGLCCVPLLQQDIFQVTMQVLLMKERSRWMYK